MTTTYDRTSDTVTRVSVGKTGERRTTSRAYAVYRFRSTTLADAAATYLSGMAGKDADAGEVLKDAARDRRTYLHVSEAAQALADAQLRELGSRPTGRHVAAKLEAWNGRGYIAIGDTVIALPVRALPSHRAIVKASVRNVAAVPAEIVNAACEAHEHAVVARASRRELAGPVKVLQLAA